MRRTVPHILIFLGEDLYESNTLGDSKSKTKSKQERISMESDFFFFFKITWYRVPPPFLLLPGENKNSFSHPLSHSN